LSSGGILENKKIGDMAQDYGVAMAVHMAESPVACMACVHSVAATENFMVLENHSVDIDWWDDIVIKPGGKLVVDIPNTTSPSGRAMMMVEEYMGRPDKFNMLPHEFEDMISDYFEIVDSDRICAESRGESYMGSMYYYYLICKK